MTSLSCSNNQLTTSYFLNDLNPELLTQLYINHNNFSQDLSFLSKFKNLEQLHIGDNSFVGSLEHLKNCEKLKWLDIDGTQLDSGLEHLPESLEEFECEETKFEEDLKLYQGDVRAWKIDQGKQALESELNLAEHRIAILQSLIKDQKQKIVEAYLHLAPEKVLLQELINAHLAYTKAKQQKLPAYNLGKKCHQIKEDLANKLSEETREEFMDKVELVLADCESLIHWMTELDEQLGKRQKLIEEQKRLGITYITNNNYYGEYSGWTVADSIIAAVGNNSTGTIYWVRFSTTTKAVIEKSL